MRTITVIVVFLASIALLTGCIRDDSKPTPTPTLNDTFVIVSPTSGTGSSSGDPEEQTYTVQDGDTLSTIAEQFGVTEQALISANGLANPDDIKVGQVLLIP